MPRGVWGMQGADVCKRELAVMLYGYQLDSTSLEILYAVYLLMPYIFYAGSFSVRVGARVTGPRSRRVTEAGIVPQV